MCGFRWCGRQLCLRNMPISGVNATPRPTAVYASDPALPRRPQDSLPSCLLGFERTRLSLASSFQLPLAPRIRLPPRVSDGKTHCDLPYARKPRIARSRFCARRARLWLIPLGPCPWLHQLRRRLPDFVRRLHRYYGRARLLTPVHHALRLSSLPHADQTANGLWPGVRPPRFRRDPFVRDVALDPGRATAPRITAPHMWPSTNNTGSAPATFRISWLNPTPHTIAVYASPLPSPTDAQHSLAGGRYPLPAPDFHRLDLASFAWRTL